jgi:hypothetical protein
VTTQPDQRLNPEKQEIIDALERNYGRPLTKEESHLSLEQARGIWGRSPTTWCRSSGARRDQDRDHR